MRRPLLGLLLASIFLASTAIAVPARAEPPAAAPAPLAPVAAPATAPPWAAPLAGTRRRSSGAMVGGIVLTALGAVATAVGTAAYVDAVSSCIQGDVGGQIFRANCDNGGTKLASMTTLLLGAASIVAGVPLWVYGSDKVAALPDDKAPKPAAAVVIGPGTAALHLSF
ncbi:MAG: hypothetical protein ABJE95_25915 [Byssovorax sp.]